MAITADRSHRPYVLGIDPGLTGAFAIFSEWSNSVKVLDMPLKKNGKKKIVDGVAIAKALRPYVGQLKYAVIEDVHSMPADGAVSAFSFGFGTGVVTGVLQALGIKIIKVKPAVWKAGMGLSRVKNDSLVMARELFPDHKDFFKFKKHDGRAEAALMAVFAMRYL